MEAATTVLQSWRETPTAHAIRVAKPPGSSFEAGQHAVVRLETDEGFAGY